jgi:endonuclease/exonuclease/phosphatase family metal-dependent hydrolase
MRTVRRGLLGLTMLSLALSGTVLTQTTATATSASAVEARVSAAKTANARPASFARRTVRLIRGVNRVTVSWPARLRAVGYTVAWSPTKKNLPRSPGGCHSPCRKRWTTGTSMVLSAPDMSTSGRTISSASGNTVQVKIFSQNSSGSSATGITYPWDSFIAPKKNTAVDWLPMSSSQMPLPLPAKAGRAVAITSFNVLAANAGGPSWARRGAKVANQIKATGASIAATQENSNVGTGVPGGVSQFMDLAARLRPSGWAIADARDWDRMIGKSHSDSTQAVRIYFKTSKWKMLSRGALMTRVGFAGQTRGVNVDRWVTWTKLQSTASSRTKVCVLSAHLLTNHGGYDRASAVHRNAEVAQIMSELHSSGSKVRRVGTRVGSACAGTPTVFAGDLNAAQEQGAYGNAPQAAALARGFVDTKNAAHRYNTRLSGPGPIGRWHDSWGTQIDYLLTRGMGGAKVFKLNTISPRGAGSDHYPITALVSVPNS